MTTVRRKTDIDSGGPSALNADEVMALLDAQMQRDGMSLGELARRAEARFGIRASSAERRLRSARLPGRMMRVHTADRFLVLVGLHLTDVPSYRESVLDDAGEAACG